MDRGGYELLPEMGYAPTNRYLPPRESKAKTGCTGTGAALDSKIDPNALHPVLRWVDKFLSR
jgi:hypothetical protein